MKSRGRDGRRIMGADVSGQPDGRGPHGGHGSQLRQKKLARQRAAPQQSETLTERILTQAERRLGLNFPTGPLRYCRGTCPARYSAFGASFRAGASNSSSSAILRAEITPRCRCRSHRISPARHRSARLRREACRNSASARRPTPRRHRPDTSSATIRSRKKHR